MSQARDSSEFGRSRVRNRQGMTVFGHRGAKAHAPENTLMAFRLAFALGADGIECDVQLCADALVIIHDATLDRTTNGHGLVSRQMLTQLRLLDAGCGERIPTHDEVLALCRKRGRQVNLEIKADSLGAALATADALEPSLSNMDENMRRRVLISSFTVGTLAKLKDRLPWLRITPLYGGSECRDLDMVASAIEIGAEAIHIEHNLVTSGLIMKAHGEGLQIRAWTVNRWTTLRELQSMKLNGVFSDYPERAIITRITGGNFSKVADIAETDMAEDDSLSLEQPIERFST